MTRTEAKEKGFKTYTGRPHTCGSPETQLIRGLLCQQCNNGLGHFDDDPELLIKAVVYLRSHNG